MSAAQITVFAALYLLGGWWYQRKMFADDRPPLYARFIVAMIWLPFASWSRDFWPL